MAGSVPVSEHNVALNEAGIGHGHAISFFFFFKQSLIAFILSRIWRWTAATGFPVGFSPLPGQSLPPPLSTYLHYEPRHCLAPIFILPQHLTLSPPPVSYPWAAHQVCRVLCRPAIAYAPSLLALPNFPQPLALRPLVRYHIYQSPYCLPRPLHVLRCLRGHAISL